MPYSAFSPRSLFLKVIGPDSFCSLPARWNWGLLKAWLAPPLDFVIRPYLPHQHGWMDFLYIFPSKERVEPSRSLVPGSAPPLTRATAPPLLPQLSQRPASVYAQSASRIRGSPFFVVLPPSPSPGEPEKSPGAARSPF